ncbi:hypothetical protein HPB48_017619 [Haemaphysalis longicornis]|uniref:Gamma-glutamylcyclotransferase n=1 Tax=Haemaphysalis longicornis TaxID=44386 RepID=A0A9J6GY62_HAELO|nr:hypothetical protein HPB48_017619 [Haemaphysalis longicornis]
MASSSGIWVFGYGSLVWNPGFDFVRSQVGYIRGYDRRFWQGNDKHRGTPDKTGSIGDQLVRSGVLFRFSQAREAPRLANFASFKSTPGSPLNSLFECVICFLLLKKAKTGLGSALFSPHSWPNQ